MLNRLNPRPARLPAAARPHPSFRLPWLFRARLLLAAGAALPLPLLALSGCQGRSADGAWLSVGSLELRRDVRVGDPARSRDESDLLHVAVPVRNTTDRQLYVQGVMTFYDHSDNPVGVAIHRTITIPAGQSERFEGNSTTPQAERFRLALSYPRVGGD